MSIVEHDPACRELVADARVEVLATGCGFLEGPAWDRRAGALLFSDLDHDVRRRFHPEHGVEVVADQTSRANGLTFDRTGRLIACEHVSSRVVVVEPDGSAEQVLASHYRGRELNSPNDVVVRSDDSIFFTDPPYGRTSAAHGLEREQELDFQGVFRIPPGQAGGEPILLADDFVTPNGLAFSPDERFLYVADTERMHVRRFSVAADGSLSGGEVFLVQGEEGDTGHGFPDGLRLDERGNLYVCGPGGVWIVSPDGEHLGTIETPEIAANVAWGDEDARSLYICATSHLLRVRLAVAGNRAPGTP